MIRLFLAALCFAVLLLAGCHSYEPFDSPYNEMTPLPGGGEMPTVENRFPKSRGGYYPAPADDMR
jgi:hypothetical protein